MQGIKPLCGVFYLKTITDHGKQLQTTENNYRPRKTITDRGNPMATIYTIYRITHTDDNNALFHEELIDTYYDESAADAVWRYLETTNETPNTWYELCEAQEPE